ncbi:MAG: flagellar motor protein MotD [Gammaproteobacteria bacterium]|nr:flagellar motor protein MotD [Gammaproteobacteria bacterium]
MARKRAPEEHDNHERWLVSYADFITLLFAFFVVMYSISSVNEGKFRVLSHSLVASFTSQSRSMDPVQFGTATTSFPIAPTPLTRTPIKLDLPQSMSKDAIKVDPSQQKKSSSEMDELGQKINNALQALLETELVSVRKSENWLEIEINSKVLFSSGSSNLSPSARPLLRGLSNVLKIRNNKIHVEGFTDNLPIKNSIYPSNWELSAARAATVVRLFATYGVTPKNLASIGYGEYQPKVDNDTLEGRATNRRVVIVIIAAGFDPRLRSL